MNLLFDFGNTQSKVAVSNGKEIIEVKKFSQVGLTDLEYFFHHYQISQSIISAVIDLGEELMDYLMMHSKLIVLQHFLKLPFVNHYKTPSTLGKDRIAAIVGAVHLYPDKNILVVDFGTAITFEVINQNKEYLGGNISPGMETRYRALHTFTNQLPLLKSVYPIPFLGQSTEEAITCGVQQGIIFETQTYIKEIEEKLGNLMVVFTGGDAIFFEKTVKYPIFVVPDLVMIGLNQILEENI